jgi:hypothetical protein
MVAPVESGLMGRFRSFIIARDMHDTEVALHTAVRSNQLDAFRQLVQDGADACGQDGSYLIEATEHGALDIASDLLAICAFDGAIKTTAMFSALYHLQYAMLKLLIQAGADLSADNNLALRYAVRFYIG